MMTCHQCHRSFNLMVIIEDVLWRRIAPENGYLCVTCMEDRLRQNGLKAKAELSYESEWIHAVDQHCISLATQSANYDAMVKQLYGEIVRLRNLAVEQGTLN
jgi:hypothetical protein